MPDIGALGVGPDSSSTSPPNWAFIPTVNALSPFLNATCMGLDLSYPTSPILSLQTSADGVALFGLVFYADGHDDASIPYCLS